jgi:serine/threonine protein kinase
VSGKFASNFEILSMLGKGGFGTVFKARHCLEDKIYAVKIVPTRYAAGMTLKNHPLLREILAMTKLNSPYVVKYVTCWVESLDDYSILEKSNGDSSSFENSDSFNSNEPINQMKVGLFI